VWFYFQAEDYETQIVSSQIVNDAAKVIQSTFNNQVSTKGRTFSVSITNISTLPNSMEMSYLSALYAAHTKDKAEKAEKKAKAVAIAGTVVAKACAHNKF
jgi:hypothetical protein